MATANRTCTFPDCAKPLRSLGYCEGHYQQNRKDPHSLRPLKKRVTTRDPDGRKWCPACATYKDVADFAVSRSTNDGLQSSCRSCRSANYRSHADEVRDKMREQRFGISRDQFDALFESQGRACAICKSPDPGISFWHTDHDHACCPGSDKTCGNCVRGILCGPCNQGLGRFGDDVDRLRSAIDYLERTTRRIVR